MIPDWSGAPCVGNPKFAYTTPDGLRSAIAVCDPCPLKAECRLAVDGTNYDGVAGGLYWLAGKRKAVPGKPRKPATQQELDRNARRRARYALDIANERAARRERWLRSKDAA